MVFMDGLYVYVIETSWVFFNDATYVFAYVLYEFHSLPSIVISDYLFSTLNQMCIYIRMHIIIYVCVYVC